MLGRDRYPMTDWSTPVTSPPRGLMRIALVGAGRVGTAVAVLLERRGHAVAGVSSRSPQSAAAAAARLGAPTFDHRRGLPPCDAVLIGAPDAAVEPVAAALAPGLAPGTVVCHFAGSLDLGPLAPATAAGAAAAALHPVQTCPSVDAAVSLLPGSAWGVTVAPGLESWAAAVVADLGGVAVPVTAGARPLWHAASVTTANGISALLAAGESLLGAAGIDDPVAVLGPLAAGAVANARTSGGGAATLTGPAVRGEDITIARHVAAIRERAPDLLDPYALAVRLILDGARRSGRVPGPAAAAVEAAVGAS